MGSLMFTHQACQFLSAMANNASPTMNDILAAITGLTTLVTTLDTKVNTLATNLTALDTNLTALDTKVTALSEKVELVNFNVIEVNANVTLSRQQQVGLIVKNAFLSDQLMANQVIQNARAENAVAPFRQSLRPVPKYDRGNNQLIYPCECEVPAMRGSLQIVHQRLPWPVSIGSLVVGDAETAAGNLSGTAVWNRGNSQVLLEFYAPLKTDSTANLLRKKKITFTSRMKRLYLCEYLGISDARANYLQGEASAAALQFQFQVFDDSEMAKEVAIELSAAVTEKEQEDTARFDRLVAGAIVDVLGEVPPPTLRMFADLNIQAV